MVKNDQIDNNYKVEYFCESICKLLYEKEAHGKMNMWIKLILSF